MWVQISETLVVFFSNRLICRNVESLLRRRAGCGKEVEGRAPKQKFQGSNLRLGVTCDKACFTAFEQGFFVYLFRLECKGLIERCYNRKTLVRGPWEILSWTGMTTNAAFHAAQNREVWRKECWSASRAANAHRCCRQVTGEVMTRRPCQDGCSLCTQCTKFLLFFL